MKARLRRPFVLPVALLLLAAPRLAAQGGGGAWLNANGSSRIGARPQREAEPVVVSGEPRSYQVVRVPIPEQLRGADSVSVQILAEAAFVVLGAPRSALTGQSTGRDLLLTIGIPADARAGLHPSARAVFRAGGIEIAVPIEVHVPPVYRIALSVVADSAGLRAGGRASLHARITNLGNAVDSVRVAVEPPALAGQGAPPPGGCAQTQNHCRARPARWRVQASDSLLVLLPGQTAAVVIRLTVPGTAATGSAFVRTVARSLGGSTEALTTLMVGGTAGRSGPRGPTARLGVTTVGVQGGGSALIGQLAVNGPLTAGIHLDGRVSSMPAIAAAGMHGLARVGTFVTPAQLTARSSTWRLGLGNTVADFGDVIGINAGGRGVSFDYDDQRTRYQLMAARPVAAGLDHTTGSILGAQFASRVGFASIGGSAARLHAAGARAQSLAAYGVDLAADIGRTMSAGGTVAYRDFERGTGVGYTAQFAHRAARNHLRLVLVHAPGGSNAFARAENEVHASVARAVSDRYDIAASYARTTDAQAAAGAVQSHSYALAQQYLATGQLALRTDVRVASFAVTGDPFSFGNGERHLGAGATGRRGAVTWSADIAIEQLRRGLRADGIDATERGARFAGRSTLSRALLFGSLMLETSYERNARGTGYLPEQVAANLRMDRAQLPFGPPGLLVDFEFGYSRWSGIRSFSTQRLGLTYRLPANAEVAFALERNPLFYTAAGRTPTVLALRLEKELGLPRVAGGTAAGVVFQDYDGDGRRDVGEPGMPNVAVRSGGARTVTASDGSYRFWGGAQGPIEVDPGTLPLGWIVNRRGVEPDIALTPTTTVQVVLQLGQAEQLRAIDLSGVMVLARDESGRTWVARRTTADGAVFEALPVGSYEIELDFSALAEPLRIEGAAPHVNVTRETVTRVVIPVAGRPLRFSNGQVGR